MIRKISKKQKERDKNKKVETENLHKLFKEIWDKREDESGCCYCFETGRAMHGSTYRNNTCCYDHVLEKSKKSFPEYAMVEKNIIIVHPDIHTLKGQNIDKTPKIKAYREYLLSLHYEGKLK